MSEEKSKEPVEPENTDQGGDQSADKKGAGVGSSPNLEGAEKARQMLHDVIKDERVKNARTKISEEFNNIKRWYSENWSSGKYGKFRVAIVSVVILLAVRGLFFGWGSSGKAASSDVASASQSTPAHSSEPASSSSWQPETHLYACKHCGNQIRSSSWPTGFKCPRRPQRPMGRVRLPNLQCEWQRMDY